MTTFPFSRRTDRAPSTNIGYTCPKCQVGRTSVKDSRQTIEGEVRRRRACPLCSHSFFTIEMPEDKEPSKANAERLKIMEKALPRLYAIADMIDLIKAEHE